jgi:hypothetical protein
LVPSWLVCARRLARSALRAFRTPRSMSDSCLSSSAVGSGSPSVARRLTRPPGRARDHHSQAHSVFAAAFMRKSAPA